LHLQNDCEEPPIALSPLAAWNNLAPNKQIFVKFYGQEFFYNQFTSFKFG